MLNRRIYSPIQHFAVFSTTKWSFLRQTNFNKQIILLVLQPESTAKLIIAINTHFESGTFVDDPFRFVSSSQFFHHHSNQPRQQLEINHVLLADRSVHVHFVTHTDYPEGTMIIVCFFFSLNKSDSTIIEKLVPYPRGLAILYATENRQLKQIENIILFSIIKRIHEKRAYSLHWKNIQRNVFSYMEYIIINIHFEVVVVVVHTCGSLIIHLSIE